MFSERYLSSLQRIDELDAPPAEKLVLRTLLGIEEALLDERWQPSQAPMVGELIERVAQAGAVFLERRASLSIAQAESGTGEAYKLRYG